MSDKPYTFDQALTLLAATPNHLAALTAALAPAQLKTPPTPGEWSANAVLAHLRACADVWGKYIARILAEDMPTIRAVSPRTYIAKTNYPDLEFYPSLQAFTAQRAQLLVDLQPLPPAGWARPALVTGVGSPLQRTVLDYAERMARHEVSHVRQVEAIAAAMRSDPTAL